MNAPASFLRSVIPGLAGVLLACAGAVLGLALGLTTPGALMLALLAGLLGGAIVAMAEWRRARALVVLERDARERLERLNPLRPPAPRPERIAGSRYENLLGTLLEFDSQTRRQIKEVAKKTRNLEALIDALDEPVLATDDADSVILCNRSAEAIFADEPGSLLGRRIRQVFTHRPLLELHAAAKRGETRRGPVTLTTATLGKRIFQVSAAPVPVAWGEGVFGVVLTMRDVTELKQAVKVKTDFVANASHELRTPVSAIRGAAETLEGALQDDPKMAARLAAMILSHSERLDEMVRDLLDLSRLESAEASLQIEPVDVGAALESIRATLAQVLEARRLAAEFEIDDDLEGMQTDRRLLMLILRNLLENAAKFAHEGTTVRVSATLVEARVPSPSGPTSGSAPAAATSGIARFEVTDQGTGIPLEHQERVFERYFQVDPARTGAGRRGTGLGLSIVKHAVTTLDGRVGIRSVWQQGTTVWFEIPVRFGPAPATGEPPAGAQTEAVRDPTPYPSD